MHDPHIVSYVIHVAVGTEFGLVWRVGANVYNVARVDSNGTELKCAVDVI